MTEPDEQRQGLFDLAKGLRGRWSIALGLVLAWVAWSLLDLVLVDLAYNVETYQYRIDVIGWRESWPLLRWIPAWTGIVLAGSQIRSFDRSRSRSCLWLIGGLVALRMISLAPSLGTVAPVLGILWSSHVSWALSLSIPVYVIYPWLNAALASRHRTVGIGLVLSFGILYLAYAVFFVRTTILHGDETQYMMIAQSLVQDGDIDLSNTSEASVLEFHELPNVYPRRAPASPPGVTHPTHPIGLGLILAPAYWLGSSIDHPRLLCALLASITGVLVLFFVHRWLIGLDFTAAGVLITTIGAGFSPLLFLYSNQLYPGIFAVAGALAVLVVLTGPVRKGCAKVFLSSLVVIALPMLHPRLLPLAGFLGVGIVLRIRSTPHPLFVAKGVAAMAAIGLAGHVLYHNHYSGDIWGPFKPGNAWEANVIDFGDLPMALCGQWLDARIGLLNNSPIYVATLVGVVAMVWRRDRLLLLAIGLYVTTACVNALSIDWRFGYCLPSRFMVTPLPALLLPMAVTVDRALRGNIPLVFVLILGGCLGWDGIREVLSLTEAAYAGGHLIYRSIDQVYPIGTHFPLLIDEAASVPWLDVIGWGAGVALLFFTGLGSRRQRMVLVIVSIVVVPAVGRAHYVDRLDGQAAPARSLRRFSSWDEPNLTHSSHQKNGFSLRNGSVIEGAHYVVRPPATRPGIVGQGVLPFVFPSVYVAAIPATALQPSDDGPKGYYVLNKRYSVRALTNHETRYAVPITFGAQAAFVRFVQQEERHSCITLSRIGAESSLSLAMQPLCSTPQHSMRPKDENFRARSIYSLVRALKCSMDSWWTDCRRASTE